MSRECLVLLMATKALNKSVDLPTPTSTRRRSGRAVAACGAPTRSSTSVPNAPQPGQRPSQRPETVPHSLHVCWTAAAFATASPYAQVPTAIATTPSQCGPVRYRQLGDSDLQVSEISLGSWLTFGGGVARADAEACIDAAFDAGINLIDTA